MIASEQKRSLLTGVKAANFKSKANIFDVFVYATKASKSAFFEIAFLPSKTIEREQNQSF